MYTSILYSLPAARALVLFPPALMTAHIMMDKTSRNSAHEILVDLMAFTPAVFTIQIYSFHFNLAVGNQTVLNDIHVLRP